MSQFQDIPMSRSVAFPDLEPASVAARRRRRNSGMISRSLEISHKIELTHDSVQDEETSPSLREEPRNEIAKITVYVLNLILMFLSFPVGMAVLIFNILGGENLRTTAHAIALTGMLIALSQTELGSVLFLPL